MTRYARAGKGTHQRVAKDSTSWNDLKPPKAERVRGANNDDEKGKRRFPKKGQKERFSKGTGNSPKQGEDSTASSQNIEKIPFGKQSGRKFDGSKISNIRGYGQSKSVKIFGQFWVPFEEGKRLNSLVKKLKEQGLPRKEILEALKNETRRAEKASKRQRDKTCFQCRQFGHILSDCPNLRKASAGEDSPTGNEGEISERVSDQGLVCFKCGSTEHTSRNCRRKGDNFEFAKCFICSGTGHIARQCPKNTKGIYPSGGSCSECGSIAHLKKDCPDLFGAENNTDSKDDDAVTLRMSDPFLSTEYEPVIDVDDGEKEKEDVPTNNEQDNSVGFTSQATSFKPTQPKNKAKRKLEDGYKQTEVFNFGTSNNANAFPVGIKQTLFANKKRKVVKF